MKKLLLLLLLGPLLLALPGFRLAPPAFRERLAAAHMTLTPPPGWTETPVIENKQVAYQYALRCPGRRLELRYSVLPRAVVLGAGKPSEASAGMFNQMAEPLFHTTMLNVAAGGPDNDHSTPDAMQAELARPHQEFPAQAVKAEFGADWGITSGIRPGPEFGQDYKYCMVVALHKKDMAQAYCFYLFDDQKDLAEVIFNDPKLTIFHSLRFE